MSMFNESALSKAMKEAYKSGGYNLSIWNSGVGGRGKEFVNMNFLQLTSKPENRRSLWTSE